MGANFVPAFLPTDGQSPHSDTAFFKNDKTAPKGEFFDDWEIGE